MSLELNTNFKLNAPLPLDDSYLNNGQPYASTSEVNTLLLQPYRHPGKRVLVAGTPNNQEYWYLNGVTDAHLVPVSYINVKFFVGTGSETSVSSPAFIGRSINIVFRMTFLEPTTNPSPADYQFYQNPSNGTLYFNPDTPLAPNETVVVLY